MFATANGAAGCERHRWVSREADMSGSEQVNPPSADLMFNEEAAATKWFVIGDR